MSKDPACLFYIDTWLTATAEMDSDCKGWYLNLILHQYDKKSLPNDIEKLGVLAGVKFSEFERFKQVFEQVLRQKFDINEDGRLENEYAKNILQNRKLFKDKRSDSGKISYSMKWLKINMPKEYNEKGFIDYVKLNINWKDLDTKNEQVFKQVFKQMFELYINENKNINKEDKEYKESKEDNNNWRTNFEIYQNSIREAYKEFVTPEFIQEQETYYQNIDVILTIKKSIKEYWITDKGWKKRKAGKTVNLDWEATFRNILKQKENRIYKHKILANEPIPNKRLIPLKNGN
jgi:hypothetical protein